ncbi:MAG TPA: carboxymuconolactone decarboxylase family protein [Ilumatobacter sp.]|nr:carboxymuconolactone decarboxylase family protein [Ilumatobacter sp.]
MRLERPRVPPAEPEEWDDDTRRLLTGFAEHNDGVVMNVLSTLAHHPKLLKRWTVFGNHVMGASTLPARERELAILRTGLLARSAYEWAQHVAIARRAGCSDQEIARVVDGPDADGWSDDDRALLRATDELMADQFIGDATWDALAQRWSLQQCLDLVFTVGQYCLVSMALNTLGVQIEAGVERFPAELFEGELFDGP